MGGCAGCASSAALHSVANAGCALSFAIRLVGDELSVQSHRIGRHHGRGHRNRPSGPRRDMASNARWPADRVACEELRLPAASRPEALCIEGTVTLVIAPAQSAACCRVVRRGRALCRNPLPRPLFGFSLFRGLRRLSTIASKAFVRPSGLRAPMIAISPSAQMLHADTPRTSAPRPAGHSGCGCPRSCHAPARTTRRGDIEHRHTYTAATGPRLPRTPTVPCDCAAFVVRSDPHRVRAVAPTQRGRTPQAASIGLGVDLRWPRARCAHQQTVLDLSASSLPGGSGCGRACGPNSQSEFKTGHGRNP